VATGYEDIDNLVNQQNSLMQQQEQKQNEIINQQTQMQIDELNREKEKVDKEVNKTTAGLYSAWQKQSNQYGAGMEQLQKQGLANSGYAESTRTSLYNTYQKNVTDALNNSRELKSEYDFKMQQARQNGSIQQSQAALDLYAQKMQFLIQNYELRQNREQYLYQQERDRVSDNQWQKTFDEQIRQNEIENQWKQKQFDYQQQRDKVADSQWQQQFNLSKKKSSSGRSSKSSSGGLTVNGYSDKSQQGETNYSQKEVLDNMRFLSGPNTNGAVVDGLSEERDSNGKITKKGKTYSSVDELLNHYGYIMVK